MAVLGYDLSRSIVFENYLERKYIQKHKRTFQKIEKDILKSLKEFDKDLVIREVKVRPRIEMMIALDQDKTKLNRLLSKLKNLSQF